MDLLLFVLRRDVFLPSYYSSPFMELDIFLFKFTLTLGLKGRRSCHVNPRIQDEVKKVDSESVEREKKIQLLEAEIAQFRGAKKRL